MHPFLTKSATELAAMIRRGETSSEAVVETHLDRLREVNPALNAVVRVRAREAREEARAADRRLREHGPENAPPFLGVPCTIKESFELGGMPHSAGLVARRGHRASGDATAVHRLRNAGAIPLGVTNVSELLMWVESNNRVYGRTNNPYDPTRVVGGSSGGEGAAVGAGIAPFGLGADIGGSIRLPAFFNGVFGHKPSAGLVPNTGQWPLAQGGARLCLCTGPLARRAEDLWPLLKVLAGPDGTCNACETMELGDPSKVDIASLRVLSVPDNGVTRVSGDLIAAQREVARDLGQAGAAVSEARFPALSRSILYWSASLSSEGAASFAALMGNGAEKPMLPEIARFIVGASDHTFPALALVCLERVSAKLGDRNERAIAGARKLEREISEELGDDGVMLFPSYSRPAPRHYAPLLTPLDFVYTAIVNVLGLPATQVPLGLNTHGLPLGVQVIAKRGNDHLTIAVAQHLEKTFGGWVPPKKRRGAAHPRRSHVPGVP